MLRKLAIAIAASGAIIGASSVHALGMGEIELESALNQPLDARIKLVKASELEDWEIKPALASSDEFDQAGVERVFFLNNVKFVVERVGSDVFINLSTKQPVVEPFLNFLVQVDWPNGRLLREYTLLLDPPVFADNGGVVAAQAPAAKATPAPQSDSVFDDEEPVMEETIAEESVFDETEAPVEESVYEETAEEQTYAEEETYVDESSVEDMGGDSYEETASASTYQVQKNDTLWEVAIQVRPDRSISPQQAMLALQDLNPDSFIGGNINRLKNNEELRIPDRDQMAARSRSEAIAEVANQNQEFAERRAQIDATRMAASDQTGEVADAELNLLADGSATTETDRAASGQVSSAAAGDQAMLDQDLSLALENLDKTTRENDELRSRLEAMEEQIDTLQRLVSLKDEQMVALQTSLGQEPEALKSDMAATDSTLDMASAGMDSEMSESKDASSDLNFGSDTADSATAESTTDDAMSMGDNAASSSDADQVAPATSSQPEVVSKPEAPKPDFTQPPVPKPVGPMDFVMSNLPMLGGAGALVLLLLVGLRILKSRKEAAEDEYIADDYGMNDPLGADQDPLAALDGDLNKNLDDEFADLELGGDPSSEPDLEGLNDLEDMNALEENFEENLSSVELPDALDNDTGHESNDVLGEAEIYMAYGRLDQAKDLLETTLQSHPERMDVRLKLLELLSEQDDAAGFSEHYGQVIEQGDGGQKGEANRLRQALSNPEAVVDVQDSDLGGLDLGDSGNDLADMSLDSGLQSLDKLDAELPDLENGNDALGDNSDLDFDIDGLDLSAPELDDTAQLSTADDNSMDFELNLDDGLGGDNEALDAPILSDDNDNSLADVGNTDLEFNLDDSLDSGSTLDDFDVELNDQDGSLDVDFDSSSEADLALASELDDLGDGISNTSDFDLPELGEEDVSLDDLEPGEGLSGVNDLSFESDLPTLDDANDLDLSSDLDALESAGSSTDDFDFDAAEKAPESGSALDALNTLDAELDAAFDSDLDFDLDDEPAAPATAPALEKTELADQPVEADLDLDDLDEDLDFLSGTDESETKLDLARAYIDMDDQDGAKEILQEVVEEGSAQQKQEATRLLTGLG